MSPKAELADFVMDHLSHHRGPDIALASVVRGLALIMTAYSDAQEKRGNWGAMLANLENGRANIEAALAHLRMVGPGVTRVVEMAEREVRFAQLMHDEITRLQAGGSTNV